MKARTFLAVSCLLLLVAAAAGCDGSSGDSDGSGGSVTPRLDDCGLPVVDVPSVCTSCHDAPPATPRHPPNKHCSRCHGMVFDSNLLLVDERLHRNGKVDVAVGCASCHGWTLGTSPPQDLTGSCDANRQGVGAHLAMRTASIPAHRVNCSNCHVIPLTTWEEGHISGDNRAKVTFGMMATANGAKPTWDGTTCSGVYCHGATLRGGTLTNPTWLDKSHAPRQCGACHRLTDPSGDTAADCFACHPTTMNADRTLIPTGTHINGTIDLAEGVSAGVRKGKGGSR